MNTIKIDDEFGLVLNCAVRYALGRMTYVPSSVIRYITPLLDKLDDKTVWCIVQDIERYKEDVDKGIGSWGTSMDRWDWMEFLQLCKAEMESRK